jgi:hypothetical protein
MTVPELAATVCRASSMYWFLCVRASGIRWRLGSAGHG